MITVRPRGRGAFFTYGLPPGTSDTGTMLAVAAGTVAGAVGLLVVASSVGSWLRARHAHALWHQSAFEVMPSEPTFGSWRNRGFGIDVLERRMNGFQYARPYWIHVDDGVPALDYVVSTAAELKEVTDKPSAELYMRRLQRALEEQRGVKYRVVDTVQLPLTVKGGEVEEATRAMYIPATNTILQTPATTFPTPEHLQTNVHEAAHALLHSPECMPTAQRSRLLAEQYSEAEAEIVTIAAMAELGMPLEEMDEQIAPAGSYQVDWAKVRSDLGPETEARIRWATDWIVTAAEGGAPSGSCPPAPSKLTVPPGFGFQTTVPERYSKATESHDEK